MNHTVVASNTATDRRSWRILIVVLVGGFMGLLDTTIVNVALPSMRVGVGASNTTMEWVVSGYALAYGLLLIPAGRLGDNRGHKFIYVGGLALFALASLACGVAQNSAELIAARVGQGISAGVFFPAISGVIQTTFSGPDRSKAFGMLGATIGLSTALGPLLGGLLVEAAGVEQGWRLVFLVNIPIAVVVLPAAVRLLPRSASATEHRRVDLIGLCLLTVGLLLLLVPLVEGQQLGWPAWTWLCVGASLVALTGLAAWEVTLQRRGGDPLFRPDLLSKPAFATGTILALVYFAAFTSIFFTLSLLWQIGLGRGALSTGLMITPFAVGSMIAAALSHRLSALMGRRVLLLGTGMVAGGLAAVLLVLQLDGATPSGWHLLAPLALAGFGNGLFIAPNTDFALSTVPRQDAGTAGGLLNTAQRVGTAIGIAVIGTVLFSTLHVTRAVNGLAGAFAHSAQMAMSVNVGLVVAAFLLVLVLPKAAP